MESEPTDKSINRKAPAKHHRTSSTLSVPAPDLEQGAESGMSTSDNDASSGLSAHHPGNENASIQEQSEPGKVDNKAREERELVMRVMLTITTAGIIDIWFRAIFCYLYPHWFTPQLLEAE